jgi:cytochrome c oxidase assembly protein subunit 15
MMSSEQNPTPRWLHYWAVLTVCATLALLFLGANVTTLQVGMADPDWPSHPLHLFFTTRSDAGYLIEHSHRLAGYVVGCCIIVLTAGLWLAEPRRWVRGMGTLALAGVIAQGVLGGYRVKLNALFGTDLALIHGCFAQLVFALLVGIALVTSRVWTRAPSAREPGLGRLTVHAALLVYGQIILGAFLRHTHKSIAQRLHFLGAFLVVAMLVWLVAAARKSQDRRLRTAVVVVVSILCFQVALGVEAWMSRFGSGVPVELQVPLRPSITNGLVRTFHFLGGSVLFATTVAMAFLACQKREARSGSQPTPREESVLEGVA